MVCYVYLFLLSIFITFVIIFLNATFIIIILLPLLINFLVPKYQFGVENTQGKIVLISLRRIFRNWESI